MPSVFIGVRVVAGGVAFGQAGKDKDVLPELSPGHLLMGTYTTPIDVVAIDHLKKSPTEN
jgi:hypothetical protein